MSIHALIRRHPLLFVLVSASVMLALPTPSAAQRWQGFVTGGVGSIDYGPAHRDALGQWSGGALVSLGAGPLAVGGQGDVLVSHGYVTGRGGFLGQISPLRRARVRPFANGGYFFGEGGRLWIAGGGVDVVLTDRFALRVFAQDAVRVSRVTGPFGGPSRTIHEPALQAGISWH
jgi:hypothetical protein